MMDILKYIKYISQFKHLFIKCQYCACFIKAKSCTAWLLICYLFALQNHAFVQQMFECPLCLGREWWTGSGKEHILVRENMVLEGSGSPEGEGSDSSGNGDGVEKEGSLDLAWVMS